MDSSFSYLKTFSQKKFSGYSPFGLLKNNKVFCPICYSSAINPYRPLSCSHYFCLACLEKWASQNKTCPMCRKNFSFIAPFSIEQIKIKFKGYMEYRKFIRLYNSLQEGNENLNDFCSYCNLKARKIDLLRCKICNTVNVHKNCKKGFIGFNSEIICFACKNLLGIEMI